MLMTLTWLDPHAAWKTLLTRAMVLPDPSVDYLPSSQYLLMSRSSYCEI